MKVTQDDAVDVDAEQRGGLVILRDRPDGATHLGVLDQKPEQHHYRDGDAQNEELHRADGNRSDRIERLLDRLGKRHLLPAQDIDREILQARW